MKKTLLVLGAAALLGLGSCAGGGGGEKTYTLRSSTSGSPTNWNPHTWEDNSTDEIVTYTEIGFVDFTYDPDVEGGYKVVYEMADKITDSTKDTTIVTEEFKTKWGIEKDQEGRVWKIDLNKDAKFASGKEITATTYVESMKRLLDSKMKNYRANTYYGGDSAIVHAYNYFNAGQKSLTNINKIPEWGVTAEEAVYLDMKGSSLYEEVGIGSYEVALAKYSALFTNAAGENLLTKYAERVPWTAEILAELKQAGIGDAVGGLKDDEYQIFFGSKYVTFDNIEFSDVGLVALNESTLLYITEHPIDEFNFNVACTSLWLVNPELYDSLKKETGGLTTTTYGTSVETYDSFGPYKLTTFQKDKQFKFERNENWYGWTDGEHEGQYQTTNIVVDIIKEHSTALLAFESGKLDGVSLEQADLAKFGSSDYLVHVPETYTQRLVFLSNLKNLGELETTAGNGKNKKILAQKDFRKAISLCIDRKRFNIEATAGDEPAYALLNSLYYYDVANDPTSIYRNTDEAKQAILDLYGMEYGEGKPYKTLEEAYKAVTGLDIAQARTLFQSAYEKAVADGTYTKGQEIEFEVGYYDATTPTNSAKTKLLNEFVKAATTGTDLEGKITFKGKSFTGSPDRYESIGSGTVEMAICAWGGAAFYPFNSMQVYCNPDYADINEIASFNPTTETLTMSYDWDGTGVKEKTKTYQGWSISIGDSSGEYFVAKTKEEMARKLHILSRLENGVLNLYNFAVLGSIATVSLNSMKISYPTDTYNIMYGFGGIRYMTYKYNDGAWTNFVSSKGGKLSYQ